MSASAAVLGPGNGAVHVWSDNETDEDLLGFRVHADLIRSIVTNQGLLPVTVGVFGDWGGGKSSIMRMLQKDLCSGKDDDVVWLYFNGWMFEGYEDAKSALLSSILIQLGEHERFGPKVKDYVVSLLKRVKLMELGKLGLKYVGVPLAAAALTGGAGGLAVAATALVHSAVPAAADKEDDEEEGEDKEKINWADLMEKAPGKPDLLEVRKFHDDFKKMLEKTDIRSLVVLIDDLDRCLPERLIETLEAIKLFVAVGRTAFVIGADPRIVEHAIATRYVQKQTSVGGSDQAEGTKSERYNLVQDYLEKLIQVPYHLPRLSPSEIETYINLLACQKCLNASDFARVLDAWRVVRSKNVYGVESGPHCQDHFSGAISLGSAGLISSFGAAEAAPAIPALEPALGSHSCGALPSAQVPLL